MKTISKILLPLSTIIATTSMVTPLVACNKEDEWKDAVDLMKYVPDPETKCKETPLDPIGATNALFSNKNAMELVKQDIYTYLAWEFKEELPYVLALLGIYWAGPAQTVVGSLSDLDLKYDTDKHIAHLSGTIKLKAVCDMVDTSAKKIGTYTIQTTHKIKNVPYHIVRTNHPWGGQDYWTSYFGQDELKGPEWYVDRSYVATANYDDSKIPDEHESSSIRFSYLNIGTSSYYNELTMIRWWSYYLSDVEPS